MDEIQKALVKAGRKDLAQEYYEKTAYSTNVIKNFEDLVKGLKEVGAPVALSKTDKSIKIDGKRFQFPEDKKDTMKSVKFDDKVMKALRSNNKLSKMWDLIHDQYTTLVENVRKLRTFAEPSMIDWGPTGPSQMRKLLQSIREVDKILGSIVESPKGKEILRKYEVLRHLFDRGYSSL